MTVVVEDGLPIKDIVGRAPQLHPDGTGDKYEEESGGMSYRKLLRL